MADKIPFNDLRRGYLALKDEIDAALAAALDSGWYILGQQSAEGKNMTLAFQDIGLFPPLVIRMLRIGENTGALDRSLLNIAYFYNREVRESISKVQAMIEPMMTVVLGAILGWVMLAVLGPVYDSISKMKF